MSCCPTTRRAKDGRRRARNTAEGFAAHREWEAEILIVGASLGGVSAALAAARAGRRVVLTEETGRIGGQATAQGVPLDEHPWIERYGSSESYRQFRRSVREYYRRNYPLTAESRADRAFNPGAGWVSALCFEPKVGRAALHPRIGGRAPRRPPPRTAASVASSYLRGAGHLVLRPLFVS